MHTAIIGSREIAELLPVSDCIEVMAEAFRSLGRGDAVVPARQVLRLPDGHGALGTMPACLAKPSAFGAKVVSVFPENRTTRYESHQGAVLLFEAANGCLLAIIDAGAITAIRTAAVSALATGVLAREGAGDLAILGAGAQAGMHLAAMHAVRRLRRVRVWSRGYERARSFAETAGKNYQFPIIATRTAGEATAGADIVCTVTGAAEPVLRGEWLAPGAHVNAVGASVPPFRELDTSAVVRSRVFVDSRDAALAQADDLRVPLQEGAIGEDHVRGELSDLVLCRIQGRVADDDITLFKSVGLAIEDLAAARHVYNRAVTTGGGVLVEFGAERIPSREK